MELFFIIIGVLIIAGFIIKVFLRIKKNKLITSEDQASTSASTSIEVKIRKLLSDYSKGLRTKSVVLDQIELLFKSAYDDLVKNSKSYLNNLCNIEISIMESIEGSKGLIARCKKEASRVKEVNDTQKVNEYAKMIYNSERQIELLESKRDEILSKKSSFEIDTINLKLKLDEKKLKLSNILIAVPSNNLNTNMSQIDKLLREFDNLSTIEKNNDYVNNLLFESESITSDTIEYDNEKLKEIINSI